MAIFSDDVLNKNNFQIDTDFDTINSALVSSEGKYDTDTVAALNTLNTTLLKTIDISEYPFLKRRVAEGAIQNKEYADFLFDIGIDPRSVRDLFLADFPVKVDISTITNLFADRSIVTKLANIINTAGGFTRFLDKIKSSEFLRTPTLTNVDRLLQEKFVKIVDDAGNEVGSVNNYTGEILDLKDRVLGIIDEGNGIFTPKGKLLVGPDGSFKDDFGNIDFTAPNLNGYDPGDTGTVDPRVITPITIPASEFFSPAEPGREFYPTIGTDNPENWTPTSDMKDYLLRLDFFYEGYYAVAEQPSTLVSPFDEISSLIGLSIDEMPFEPVVAITEKQNIELVSSIEKEYEDFDREVNNLVSNMETWAAKNLSKANAINDKLNRFLHDANMVGSKLEMVLNNKYGALALLLGLNNVEHLKQKVMNVANVYRMQFERMVDPWTLLPKVIPETKVMGLIAVANLAKNIKSMFDIKVNEFKRLADRTEAVYNAQKIKSYQISRQALNAGAIRINPSKAVKDAEKHGTNVNRNSDWVNPDTHYIDLPMTEEEKEIIEVFKPSEDILSVVDVKTDHIVLAPVFIDQYREVQDTYHQKNGAGVPDHEKYWNEDENIPSAPYSMIYEKNSMLLVRLHRMGEVLKDSGNSVGKLMLMRGYTSPYFINVIVNQIWKQNWSSTDASQSCHSLIIRPLRMSQSDIPNVIKAASQVGFNGIKLGKNLKVMALTDLEGDRAFAKDIKEYPRQIRKAMERHINKEYTYGKKA